MQAHIALPGVSLYASRHMPRLVDRCRDFSGFRRSDGTGQFGYTDGLRRLGWAVRASLQTFVTEAEQAVVVEPDGLIDRKPAQSAGPEKSDRRISRAFSEVRSWKFFS